MTLTGVLLDLENPFPVLAGGTLTVGLFQDSAISPGSLIANLGTINDINVGSGVSAVVLTLSSHPTLAANTRY